MSTVKDSPADTRGRDDDALAVRWSTADAEGTAARDAALARLRTRTIDSRPRPERIDLRSIPLRGQDLSGLDLTGIDFGGADLSECNLTGTRLTGATLREAILTGATLDEAELLGADLSGAAMFECSAERAGFGRADLTGAVLFDARLEGSTFTQARLGGADLRAAKLSSARFLGAELQRAELTRAVMVGVDLAGSDVSGAEFRDVDLRNSRMRGIRGFGSACWIGANTVGVDYCGAYRLRRVIEDQNYLHEFRAESRMNAAIYWVWWATSDCGRSFLRWSLWILLLAAVFAGLYQTVQLDLGDHPTWLSSMYFSVVTLTTLGYGDVVPASPAAQTLAICQVALGYLMLGGLLSIFSNKMARRAD